ncbi:MAG: lipid II flippase Amj family protein [Acidobacteria bacterium]|nr:lipid II flippase Amj family protein [Acidobacteriota bacterium]
MSKQIAVVFLLTFVIHLISTLAYALRIAGVRTGRIAVSFALFNLLVLISRTSNTFQGPLLAKHVEQNITRGTLEHAEGDFRWLLLAATLATIAGAFLIPSFQRLFTKAIEEFNRYRSIPRLVAGGFSRFSLRGARSWASLPTKENLSRLTLKSAPINIIIYNVFATALLTVGVFASLYAGYLNPELRVTANSLSPVVNGLSTILLFVYIDPYLSILTDDVVSGKVGESYFRNCVVLFVLSRLAGTLLAQAMFIPAANIIVRVAKLL